MTITATRPARVGKWTEQALRVLRERYLSRDGEQVQETPEEMCWRVAVAIAQGEGRWGKSPAVVHEIANAFYDLMVDGKFLPNSPTLMNAGKGNHLQYSACYVLPVGDSMEEIFDAVKSAAIIHKSGGGTGFAFSRLRQKDAVVTSTGGKASGPVSFLRVFNGATEAVKQGGTRRGANMDILRIDHPDILEFIECKLDGGIVNFNISVAATDAFMDALQKDTEYDLIAPHNGEVVSRLDAREVFDRIVRAAWQTGDPGMVFLDRINASPANPTPEIGLIEATNPCGEQPLLPNEACNLGSINLLLHLTDDGLDFAKIKRTISTAMRMLDNVIDINYYAVEKARNSNLRHRPVGLGIMGFQDCLHKLRVPYASQEAVEFADRSMEMVAYAAYWASTELAEERGRYASFHGSLWERGILPQDTLDILSAERGGYVELDRSSSLDWEPLRSRIKRYGMRNSNCLAIAPTATIANIVGVSASIEPTYQNLFVKSNLSGEFTVVNEYLVRDLKRAGLWDEVMIADLKYFDGNLGRIDRAPAPLRKLYATAFEVEPRWLVECAARRQKWIDQSQSLNIYMAGASGKKLDETYKLAWIRGLKTTYYLRALGATHAEKSTVKTGELNAVSAEEPKMCSIDKPDCEACQ